MMTPEHTTEEKQRAHTLDGAGVAAEIKSEVGKQAARLQSKYGVRPGLAVVRVGDDPASIVYVNNKVRTSESLGFASELHVLPSETGNDELLAALAQLNARDDVDGILVQLPLPAHIDETRVIEAVDPAKDVDGLHPINAGRLALGQKGLVPCTPAGIIELLVRHDIKLSGMRACIVGRSNIVGKPMAQLLLQRDATITVCHSRTRDLAAVTREADLLIVAVGRAAFIRAEHIKLGAIVVDVGMNRVSDEQEAARLFGDDAARRIEIIRQRGSTLIGDVHPAEAMKVAGWLTPVPGGVGPLTVAMLMRNTLQAAMARRRLTID